jgi:hypothetical protein
LDECHPESEIWSRAEVRALANRVLHVIVGVAVVLEVLEHTPKGVMEKRAIHGNTQAKDMRVRRECVGEVVQNEITVSEDDVVLGIPGITLDLSRTGSDDLSDHIGGFFDIREFVGKGSIRGIVGNETTESHA